MNILVKLFFTFAKIGLFTFGGGYAMIPIIERDCVDRKKWITHDEMMNITAIAESTPGPIAINCATFTGYKVAGFMGSLVSTLGVVLPSFVIIYLISLFFNNLLDYPVVANAFKGIKMAVGVLIADAAINMFKKIKKCKLSITIMVCSAVAMLCINIFAWNFSSISLMLIAAAVNLTAFAVRGTPQNKGGEEK